MNGDNCQSTSGGGSVGSAAIAVAATASAFIFPRLYLETRELWDRAPAYAAEAYAPATPLVKIRLK